MTTALYRRYRPDNFADLIGQTQVTDPLRAALKSDRVHHAYLFSGPRGCGKTTSARILARCLNCAEGPTDTPCGKCDSCIELAKGGPGSLDVVEIDAASHNGVDDARDLRERAVFAPARDRFKIFILDEAHMVTTQGFNALLKIVEEPPAHVKFIFATTEPEKVIGTIRSRTHHYPFRLVPPAELLTYLDSVLKSEGYEAEDGVLPMVVRASGGSVRDALSLLDQLIAGSDSKKITYERSINLLGFTHDNLMADVIEAFAELDAAKAFTAVDKIIQSGQDARRFLEDLLERIRDLMLVHSLGQDAKAILRGIGPEQFEQLTIQAARFGLGSLTQTAEATAKALSDTSAASNPRLQLELLCARVLAPAAKQTTKVISEPVAEASKPPVAEKKTESRPTEKSEPTVATKDVSASFFKANWQIILDTLAKQSRSAWAVAFTSKVIDYNNEVLTLLFQSQKDVEAFRNSGGAAEVLRSVIREMTGVSVKYRAKVADAPSKVSPAPVIESNQDDFSDEEEHEELKTEPIETADPRTGEFILREVLGAKPIKGEK
ncbi:MAG: polymerase subunit gamma/tau [Actinomycetota bacterium]